MFCLQRNLCRLVLQTRARPVFVRHGQQEEGQAVMTRSTVHLRLLPAATRHSHVLHGLLWPLRAKDPHHACYEP